MNGDVEAWFDRVPEAQRDALLAMRALIRECVPDAGEKISYGVPTFVLNGSLVALNASKSGLSLITMRPSLLADLAAQGDALAGVKWSGSTLRFTPDQPLPAELVRTVIEARAEQNREGT